MVGTSKKTKKVLSKGKSMERFTLTKRKIGGGKTGHPPEGKAKEEKKASIFKETH